jgi:hypothetical protein
MWHKILNDLPGIASHLQRRRIHAQDTVHVYTLYVVRRRRVERERERGERERREREVETAQVR